MFYRWKVICVDCNGKTIRNVSRHTFKWGANYICNHLNFKFGGYKVVPYKD